MSDDENKNYQQVRSKEFPYVNRERLIFNAQLEVLHGTVRALKVHPRDIDYERDITI